MDMQATATELDLQDDEATTSDVFTLTSLIDSSAAQQAAERLYSSGMNGLRFFSELNRAVPRSRAAIDSRRLEQAAAAEIVEMPYEPSADLDDAE